MIYTLDLLIGLYIIITGFCAAWIALSTARMLGWKEPVFIGHDGAGIVGLAGEFALTALVGPRLLIANGVRTFREGELTAAVFALTVIAAGTWAAFVGIIVLQCAYLSGLFLS